MPNSETPLTSISAGEALENILSHFSPLEPVPVPFMEALGLVLAEDVYSDIDIPPFDNSSMDGYAVRAGDVEGASSDAPAKLRVAGYLPAGAAPRPSDYVQVGTAFRIMTGAPIPPGADAVIPFEETSEGRMLRKSDLQPRDARAEPVAVGSEVLVYKAVRSGDYVRNAGEDLRRGDVALRAGATIRAAEIGVMAAVGKSTALVHPRPRVAILASGDELVDVDHVPGPGQIRNSNNYAVAAQVTSWGAQAINLGVARDDREHLLSKVNEALSLRPDLLITSAGVSVGDYDIVKDVLMSLGSISMWRVRVKPGKPLAFGRLGEVGVPFLGLPGNPVSSMVSMELFGRPAIMKMLGKARLHRPVILVRALEPVPGAPGRENYVRAIVSREGDEYVARSTGKQESNILTSMARANSLLVVDEQTRMIEAGGMVRALMLDWPEEVF
ncbi:MAG TPA: gephyrin-like molybdotransferase Glp [Chloroflexia bacterium]|nr:gephyrin-like molybdotransferase Glp [Chloroflexia bacterium]